MTSGVLLSAFAGCYGGHLFLTKRIPTVTDMAGFPGKRASRGSRAARIPEQAFHSVMQHVAATLPFTLSVLVFVER